MADKKEEKTASPSDARSAGPKDRMRAANEQARRERLRTLTLEAALREFEQLCREVRELYEGSSGRRSHPVGLIKNTR